MLEHPIKCHFMTDGKSDKTIVTLTKFWLACHSQSMKRGWSAFFTAFIVLPGVPKEAGNTAGKLVREVRVLLLFAFSHARFSSLPPPPPPFHFKRPQRRPIDLNNLHVLFSQWRPFLFIDCAYRCAWIRQNLKETVLKSFITGPTLRKQNMQAREIYCVPNNQRRLQACWREGIAELSRRRTDCNSLQYLLNL